MRTRTLLLALCALCAAQLVPGAESPGAAAPALGLAAPAASPARWLRGGDEDGSGTGLRLRLGEGAPEASVAAGAARGAAVPLTPEETDELLQRLPAGDALPDAESERDGEFAFRESSLPPPRPGEAVDTPFPPPAEAAPPAVTPAAALAVLRHAPDGDVPLAPHLSVTFSQPMVAVTTQAAAAETVPVRLKPAPAGGSWRWIGTQTLLFEPDLRFPMATEYEAVVPQGTVSAVGGVLAAPVRWTFRTPAPRVVASGPTGGPQPLEPLLFAVFDQRIEPAAVLAETKVQADGKTVPVRLATAEEVAGEAALREQLEAAPAERWLAFRPTRGLPPDSEVTVTFGPDLPGAEGPRRTEEAQSFTFRTYGAFAVTGSECGWGGACRPFTPWRIEFTNPIDEDSFDRSLVTIDPPLEDARVEVYGASLGIRGPTKGHTRYTVKVDGRLKDAFGQKLVDGAKLTFSVGAAEAALDVPGAPFVTLDPSGPAELSVFSVNYPALIVEVYHVDPLTDWPDFARALRSAGSDEEPPRLPGRRVVATTVETKGEPDTLTETRIDLRPALEDGFGHAVVVVAPPRGLVGRLWGAGDRRPVYRLWAQATQLGLTAAADAKEMLAWTTELRTGRPVGDVRVTVQPGDAVALSDPEGLARLPLWDRNPDPEVPPTLVARKGLDSALLPERLSFWGGESRWNRADPGETLLWYVFDDRALYRPGEEARVKGWLRRQESFEGGDLEALAGAVRGVQWRVEDAQGNEIGAGTTGVTALGGFDLALPLPATMNLGTAYLELTADAPETLDGREYTHTFDVQEFRRPEFEVTASASEGPHLVGGHAVVSVTAAYFAGGGLPGAGVGWQVETTPGRFTPPGRGDYVFGTWVPWWERPARARGGAVRSFEGRTDGGGAHHLRLDFESAVPPRPTHVSASATVMDVNRQAWTATAALLVHPAAQYVGLRAKRTFVDAGQPLTVDVIATDLDGALLAGRPVTVEAVRREWVRKDGRWTEEDADRLDCEVQSAADRPVPCELTPKKGGTWRVRAALVDDAGRPNRSELTLWVAGGGGRPPEREVERQAVLLVPDRERYQPGDVAEVLVQAPFPAAEGLVTLRRSGVVSAERFTMVGPTHVLRVPIDDEHGPNVRVHVELVGEAPRVGADGKALKGAPSRPAFAGGEIDLAVPPLTRALQLVARPREARVEPGASTTIDVSLKDAAGRPVADGEVAVVVVDEAVLALSAYQLSDPLEVFYPRRDAAADDAHLRSYVLLADLVDPTAALERALDQAPGGAKRAVGMPPPKPGAFKAAADDGPGAAPAIALREDFRALALFAPVVQTGPDGRAAVTVELPDSLTRYRVMAVGVGGGREFGSAEAAITARLPLMVRPSAPRFLNYGDHFELPVVIQNQTDAPLPVSVAVRATNATVAEPRGQMVTVPPSDRVEVRFPVDAAQAGTARFQVAAAAAGLADAAAVTLPVWTPATTEAFATYGVLDAESAVLQPIRAPEGVNPAFGGLDVTTSVTALQSLTDAVLYLAAYPFECSEQLASRVLAVAALRDVLAAFEVEGRPPPEELQAAAKRDVERLRGLQNDDGGFGFWRRDDEAWPWVSIHAAHALARAGRKGFAVPADVLERSKEYLRAIESHIPAHYGAPARQTLAAYALYVRRLLDDPDYAAAQKLVREVGAASLPLEAAGFLLPVLAADPALATDVEAVLQHVGNRVAETAAGAHFVTGYDDDGWLLLHSDRRADGILLEALVEVRPTSDLLPKLVQGLLGHRKKGRWSNTQENAFILVGLDRYFAEFESQPPELVARIWLGDRLAAEHAFSGPTADRQHVEIPLRTIAQAEREPDLVVSREGVGRLYYRIGMRYAPTDLTLTPADHGFTVERAYEPVDDAADVRRAEDGTWHVKAGARVRVRLTMVAPARRHHVALVDPLPAGLEPLNPTLATTGPLPADPKDAEEGGWWWWTRTWYEHQNLRDERVEAFASLLWEGVHTYTYVARATTPGTFVVPPPKAEEMYEPETFGRGASARLVVE